MIYTILERAQGIPAPAGGHKQLLNPNASLAQDQEGVGVRVEHQTADSGRIFLEGQEGRGKRGVREPLTELRVSRLVPRSSADRSQEVQALDTTAHPEEKWGKTVENSHAAHGEG
jgi:hypothetical protein